MINERIHEFSNQEIRKFKWSEIIPISSVLFLVAYLTHVFRELEKQNQIHSEFYIKLLFLLLELFGDLSSCIYECKLLQKAVFDSNLVLLCIGKVFFSISFQFLLLNFFFLEMLKKTSLIDDFEGLKVDLIRIIGNLSYKHFLTQEQIRINHGLELILNSTRIDPKNECL